MKRIKSRTNVNGSSGRPSNKSLESVDRIGFLPDSILGIILSFLPTKNAVATSVLSKRWKLVWMTIHNLDLCYEDRMGKQDERDDMRFVGFVNRVLLHHDAGWLNKFRLVWSPRCISSHATSWITTAISKNVHELSLRLETHTVWATDHCLYRESPEPFVMPICVFSCTTLRFLELNGGISISAAIVVCLPTLETIKLDSVYFQSEEAFAKLIRGCPMLINLLITRHVDILFEFRQDDDFKYKISSASLRLLEIRNDYELDVPFHINLELEASSLEYLKLVGDVFIPVFFLQNSLSSLVEAEFDIVLGDRFLSNADICNLVVEAVRELHCAKALILSADIIWALSRATITLSTEFKRLVRLEAETYCCGCSSLRDFIQCSDILEVLTVLRDPMDEEDESDHDHSDDEEDESDHDDSNDEEDEYDDDDSNDEEDESDHDDSNDEEDEHNHDHSNWTTPVEVPRCLSTSLKKVVLDGYYGNEDEREMIRYMLKHGSALEAMRISCDGSMKNVKKLKLVREICMFPRKSIVCEVEVSDR